MFLLDVDSQTMWHCPRVVPEEATAMSGDSRSRAGSADEDRARHIGLGPTDGAHQDSVDVPWTQTPEQRLHAALWTAESWPEVVCLLHHDLGLSKAEIARGAGVAPIT